MSPLSKSLDFVLVLPFVLAFALGGAPTSRGGSVPEQLDQLLAGCQSKGLFNGVCLVADGGQVVFSKAYGYKEPAKTALIDDQTTFEIASITKPFTATAILLLAKEGKLQLTDDVSKFIPRWPYSGITLQHLLTHTSGLPDYRSFLASDWSAKRVAVNADLISRLVERTPRVYFPAGEGWNYCNTGYVVLAQVVEQVSGQSYASFVHDQIFKPLGMTRSGVVPERMENSALGYLLTRRGYEGWSIDLNMGGIIGDGGIFTTAEDLHRFAQSYFSGKLLGELTSTALTPVRTKNGVALYRGVGAGLGWNLKFEGDEKTPSAAFHTGNYGGFRAVLWQDLRKNRTLILLDNVNHNLDEVTEAVNSILENKPWVAPKKSIADSMLLAMPTGGIEAAMKVYRKAKNEKAAEYTITEREINTLGYMLLYDDATDDAIKVFQLNVEEHPGSFNAFDGLAEAYVKKGDVPGAIGAYEQAVKLNPGYVPGIEALQKLRQRARDEKE